MTRRLWLCHADNFLSANSNLPWQRPGVQNPCSVFLLPKEYITKCHFTLIWYATWNWWSWPCCCNSARYPILEKKGWGLSLFAALFKLATFNGTFQNTASRSPLLPGHPSFIASPDMLGLETNLQSYFPSRHQERWQHPPMRWRVKR